MQEHCGESHGILTEKVERTEKDVNSLWEAHRHLSNLVMKLTIRVATIVGGATAFQIAAMLFIQIYFKKHGG